MQKKNSTSQQNLELADLTVASSFSVTSSTGYAQSGTYSSYSRPPFENKIYNHSRVEKDSDDEVVIFLNASLDLVLASCNLAENKVDQLKVSRKELVEYCTEKELKKCLEVIATEDL